MTRVNKLDWDLNSEISQLVDNIVAPKYVKRQYSSVLQPAFQDRSVHFRLDAVWICYRNART